MNEGIDIAYAFTRVAHAVTDLCTLFTDSISISLAGSSN
jgi:hypothetical protein